MNQGKWFGLVVVILLSACGGKHAAVPLEPPASAPQLGSLGDYARHASIDDASQVRFGSEMDTSIPTSRVGPDFDHPDTLIYFPTAGPPLNPAYAIYSFNLTGYDEEPLLRFHWDVTPNLGEVWVALSNWDDGRWEYISQDPTQITLDSLAPFISPNGTLLLALIAVDSQWHRLRWLSVGDAPAPGRPRIYDVFPRSSQPDQPLTLSATVTGTEPLTYSWEFGGGATPDTESAPKPTVTMGPLGDYQAKLTLSNKYGSYELPFELHSVDPTWTPHLVGNAGDNRFVAVDTTWVDHSLVAGLMGDGRVSVFEFDAEGTMLWNRAYTGLPANHVTAVVLSEPWFIQDELDLREFYLACYMDDGNGPGNAYALKIGADGSVLWYQPLGQGIPDLSRIDDNLIAVSLAGADGHSMVSLLGSDGTVLWSKRTVGEANYYCSSGGIPGEGIYLAGAVDGKSTLALVDPDGNPVWTFQYPGNGTIRDCTHIPESGAVIIGNFPLAPDQIWDTFYMVVRDDGMQLAYEKFRTANCRAESVTTTDGFVVLMCNAIMGSSSQLHVVDGRGNIYRSLGIEGFGQLFGTASRFTRHRPPTPGPKPPDQPPETLVLVGTAWSSEMTISQISVEPVYWRPVENVLSGDLEDTTLPQESLSIVPEEVSYTVDTPAGGFDGLFMRIDNAF